VRNLLINILRVGYAEIWMRDNILDKRFEGKAVRIYIPDMEEPLEGVVDEVSKYEIGIRPPKGGPVVVFRHAIAYVEVSQTDLHGFSSEELEDVIITPEMSGGDVVVFLRGNVKIAGKLAKVSKYEIGLRVGDKALIVPKSSISHIVFHQPESGD
jgi:sRNA-binding regulator protein Hfq